MLSGLSFLQQPDSGRKPEGGVIISMSFENKPLQGMDPTVQGSISQLSLELFLKSFLELFLKLSLKLSTKICSV